MRKAIINATMFGIVGGVLAATNVSADMWQFWVVVGCMAVVQINSGIDT